MTREEALEMLKDNSNVIHQTINGETDAREVEALDMAINALEQQPCGDVIHRDRTVQDFADKCRECGREKVLDKIKSEIDDYLYNNEFGVDYRADIANIIEKRK